jgi:glycosyltransferase involved in cell wall biosynthesis
LQLVVVDDASSDSTVSVVESLLESGLKFDFIINETNLGNCKAFNLGLKKASGKYIIDLAADDILMPERIARGVADFEKGSEQIGVSFCDTWLVQPDRLRLRTHFRRNESGELLETVPSGDLYQVLIRRHLISAPTMMMRKAMLDSLGGYDETLAYEDFDFWVRSARKWHYSFVDTVLVEKRILASSLSTKQFKRGSLHELSTYKVCEKAFLLNINKGDYKVLAYRVMYESKQALFRRDFSLFVRYMKLLFKIGNKLV